jgi:pyruvate dehydrogenase E1 component beta subunit
MSATTTYRQAVALAIGDAMEADEDVFLIGEDVAAAGGTFKLTEGLYERFGGRRVRDTPISEQAIVGTVIGAAVAGLRPVAEIMFADFVGTCHDQIANEMAKYRYMTGGQVTMPATLRMASGAGGGFGAQHSQSVENWFLNVPGLKLVLPGTPSDVYGLLRAAIEDPDPVLVFEHKSLFNTRGEVDRDAPLPEIGRAAVVRPGADVTVVAAQLMRARALEAAESLAGAVDAEVIDPRTVSPLDIETVVASLARTGRLLVVQECPPAGSWGGTLIAEVACHHADLLEVPPVLLSADDAPIPYAGALEAAWMPDADRIATAARRLAET